MDKIRQYVHRISPISDTSWSSIKEILTECKYEKGHCFARSGQNENRFGIVTEGVLKAWISNADGVEYIKTFFTPIDFTTPVSFIGAYSSLISNTVNHVEIQSLTPTTVWEANYSEWTGLYEKNRDIETWSRRLAEFFFVSKEIREFQYFTMDADKRYELFKQQYPELELLIPQYDIARYLGISPTQLSRIRGKIAKG